MGDDPAQHDRALYLFGEVAHVVLIATGCYAGWKLGETFAALLAGGAAARAAWFFALGVFHLVLSRDPGGAT